MKLWSNQQEIHFFKEALKSFASPEQLFYHLNDRWLAYIPKSLSTDGKTLQSRNSLIGKYTERWCRDLFSPIAEKFGLCAVNDVICEEIGLNSRSNADLAFCVNNDTVQTADNIKLIFEIKMSVVSNYEFIQPDHIKPIGNYNEHRGNPSLLRSDSMLKAIGKSVNIRVAGSDSHTIPIIILGNSPISKSYIDKVDFLKEAGIVQGFWNLNQEVPIKQAISSSPAAGFSRIADYEDLYSLCEELINKEMCFFSSMLPTEKIGSLIRLASAEPSDIQKGEKFLQLLRGNNE